MQYIAPLIQTVLWVGLIVGIVWRFHAPIYGLLTALQRRIESGSNIKAGPFELSEQIHPQGVAQQVERAQAEVNELLQGQSAEIPELQHPATEVKTSYIEAEDLALRALQLKYGKPINRQVAFGPDFAADGAFTVEGQLNLVEVKHFMRSNRALPNVRRTLESIQEFLRGKKWGNVNVVLAVVLHYAGDVDKTRRQLSALKDEFDFSIDLHCYSLDDLKSHFAL